MKICLPSGKSKDLLRVTASVQSWPFLALHSTFQIKLLCASWYPGVQLGGRGEVSPALFWKSKKSALIFGKKGPVIVHLCVEYSIQNVVLRVLQRKVVFLTKYLSKYPIFTNHPPRLALKISACEPTLRHSSLCKTLFRRCLTTFWICFCPDNCSVIIKWTYTMYCIRHIQNSGILSTLFFQVYAGIFKHLQHPV